MQRDDLDKQVRQRLINLFVRCRAVEAETGATDKEQLEILDEGRMSLELTDAVLEGVTTDLGVLIPSIAHGFESASAPEYQRLSDQLRQQSCCTFTRVGFALHELFAFFAASSTSYREAIFFMATALDVYIDIGDDVEAVADVEAVCNTVGPTELN